MTITGAIAEAGKDRPIYLRVAGFGKNFWYVIEEKSPMESALSSGDEVIGCKSETDRVRQLPLPDSGSSTNNLVVLNSCAYLIGGDGYTLKHMRDESLGYRYIDLRNLDMGIDEWLLGGGKLGDGQFRGGVAVGHDSYAYCVGPTVYRFRPGVDRVLEKLPVPPQGPNPKRNGFLHRLHLLGLTMKKLYVYSQQGGAYSPHVMLSYDLESEKWDEDVLDDNLWGNWSPGAVLYEDRYLFSFGTRSPKRKPKPEEEAKIIGRRRVQVEPWDELVPVEAWDELVPGIYVFDLEERQWLPEPVQGLSNDGIELPHAYRPSPEAEALDVRCFSPRLFQIRKDDDHRLALLWDGVGMTNTCKLFWCKFMINRCNTTTNDIPRFSANSLSPGFCPLDEKTFQIFNSAVGM